ncbi:MAG: hypothetical protein OEU90_03475 [Gammaproteobacteria bacterium]|jgi:flagellar basal body-associated protein FliL|nr:hypothetical protein [Gammaproteobacteria bacterium]MDH3750178.1 hypothetical protein [Gammaproteobacteria bacterium]MDH3804514.1 hypothetical protein [Gammaproteobacteria bacterium]
MRSALPFILVFLAVFTAGCIAYIAWELSSDKDEQKSAGADDTTNADD